MPLNNKLTIEEVTNIARNEEWVLGATNLDEDIHFSNFYLRASADTKGQYPGFSKTIAVYRPFWERYYVLKKECLENSDFIIKKSLEEPTWISEVLRNIYTLSDLLSTVFPENLSSSILSQASSQDLINLYKRHKTIHARLYRYARLPEALDRGILGFTTYLQRYLREMGVEASMLKEVFNTLVQPIDRSTLGEFGEELFHFTVLLKETLPTDIYNVFQKSPLRARMLMPPILLERMNDFVNKWKFVSYHGYGRRQLMSLDDLLQEMQTIIILGINLDRLTLMSNNQERIRYLNRHYHIDKPHQKLFEFYPKIEAAKIYRRYIQLRNFYYLDLLIADVARRLRCSEWTIRCMLPEELVTALKNGNIPITINDRLEFMVYAIIDGQERVFTGADAKKLESLLSMKPRKQNKHSLQLSQRQILRGTVVSLGKNIQIKSVCKVVNRREDKSLNEFPVGAILVSQAADPDLFNYIIRASAVITEEGGVTSHASILCREMGIPAIMGIKNLTSIVHGEELLVVDMQSGTVEISTPLFNIDTIIIPYEKTNPNYHGYKAYNLVQVAQHISDNIISVPQFLILSIENLKKYSKNVKIINAISEHIKARLALSDVDEVAIRSSAVMEDQRGNSNAGQFTSYTNVLVKELSHYLQKYIDEANEIYAGSIIVQRMVNPDFSGVCLTCNPLNSNTMIVEFKQGYNFSVTHGDIVPSKCEIVRDTGDVTQENFDRSGFPAFLLKRLLDLEKIFGNPLDIEWAIVGEKLHIIQVRSLATSA
jgi:phosphohistidine swiveling domain-containing protein